MAGFSENVRLRPPSEKVKKQYEKIYPGSDFRHRFLIKPVSFLAHRVPKIGLEICMPVSGGALLIIKNIYSATLFRKSASDE